MRSRIICISDVLTSQRLDVTYHSEDQFLHGFVPLSNYISINGGKRLPKGKTFSSEKTSYLYLRLADIVDLDNIDYTKLPSISETIFNTLKRYEIKEGEVSISIAGTIGKVFITKNIPMGKRVILTENCAIIRPKAQSLSPIFLKLLLNCTFVQQQIKRNSIQTTIPKIGLDRIGKLRIPVIPPIHIQEKIINIYTQAQEAKQAKDEEAKSLLSSIDSYILKEIGVILPSKDTYTKEIIVSLSQLVGNRYDPYYKLYFDKDYRSVKYESLRLGSIANICKGAALTSKDVIPGSFPVIAGGKSSPYSHNEYNFHGNLITVSASGAYAGYVWYHENPIFASDCSVIYSKDESIFTTKYIFEVLKAFQSIIYRLQVGAAQPHVYPSDLMNLYIPVLPSSKQGNIVETISCIRNRAKQLQKEGVELLETAKQEIEKLILGL